MSPASRRLSGFRRKRRWRSKAFSPTSNGSSPTAHAGHRDASTRSGLLFAGVVLDVSRDPPSTAAGALNPNDAARRSVVHAGVEVTAAAGGVPERGGNPFPASPWQPPPTGE